jgi:hypothetical protein
VSYSFSYGKKKKNRKMKNSFSKVFYVLTCRFVGCAHRQNLLSNFIIEF